MGVHNLVLGDKDGGSVEMTLEHSERQVDVYQVKK